MFGDVIAFLRCGSCCFHVHNGVVVAGWYARARLNCSALGVPKGRLGVCFYEKWCHQHWMECWIVLEYKQHIGEKHQATSQIRKKAAPW